MKDSKFDISHVISMIKEEVDGFTVDGIDCPECGSTDFYGHLNLTEKYHSPGLMLHSECLYCGYSNTGEIAFNE